MTEKVGCIPRFRFAGLSIVDEQNEPTKHVALVGMTGVGKSTLINVLIGSNCATANNNVAPCTRQLDHYDIEHQGVRYTLWDTRGWNEASESWPKKIVSWIPFIGKRTSDTNNNLRELREFLRGQDPEINLVLFCIEAKKIQVEAQWNYYHKINDKYCRRKKVSISVGVVVTQASLNYGTTEREQTCKRVVKAAGGVLDARLVEAMPVFEDIEDTSDSRRNILKLISNFT